MSIFGFCKVATMCVRAFDSPKFHISWTYSSFCSSVLEVSTNRWTVSRGFFFRLPTHIQKNDAISRAFWKRIKWIKKSTIRGRWNQKSLSEGLITKSPSTADCFSATSLANWVMTCANLVPTASRSCNNLMRLARLTYRL